MRLDTTFDPDFDAPVTGKEKGRPKRRRLVEALVVVGITGSFGLFLGWPIVTSENFGKPLGRAIPSAPPDETNRVVHSQGFSIVLPPNWEPQIIGARSVSMPWEIYALPRQLIPARGSGGISVIKYDRGEPFDVSGYQSTLFQGMPAHERISTQPGVFLDSPPRFHYALAFQRAGCWYELNYSLASEPRALPRIIQHYFDTFRVQSGSDHGQRTTDH
jgi:hypothetical protein